MKRILACVVLITAAASFALGQMSSTEGKSKGGEAGVKTALMQMERDWVDAAQKKDTARLGTILADDWAAQGSSGPSTKAQTLAELKSGDNKLDSITLGEMNVRVFRDTAVVTGSDDEKSSYKGKDTSGHYVWTDVFVNRKGHWQAVASQNTLMAP